MTTTPDHRPQATSVRAQIEECLDLCTDDKMSTLARITNIKRILRNILDAVAEKEKAREAAADKDRKTSGAKAGNSVQKPDTSAPGEVAL